MRCAAAVFLCISVGAGWGQSPAASPSFEVASIRRTTPFDGRGWVVSCTSNPVRIACTAASITMLVQRAYGLKRYEIAGVSGSDAYDVEVRLPEGALPEQIQLMWQNLLADRFKMTAHRETREVQGYTLTVAKGGIRMRAAPETPLSSEPPKAPTAPDLRPQLAADGFPALRSGMSMAIIGDKARWREDATTERIAGMLAVQLAQPVIDATGLKGKYAVTLSWITGRSGSSRSAAAGSVPIVEADDPEGEFLADAVRSQLGLVLEPKKVPVQILVVDHLEKPTDN